MVPCTSDKGVLSWCHVLVTKEYFHGAMYCQTPQICCTNTINPNLSNSTTCFHNCYTTVTIYAAALGVLSQSPLVVVLQFHCV